MVEIPEEDRQEYEVMMQDARGHLSELEYYSDEMLALQKRIRCRLEAYRYECTE